MLANVPAVLEAHYQRLRQAEESALAQAASASTVNTANTDNTAEATEATKAAEAAQPTDTTARPEPAGVAATVTPGAWRRVFRRDMEDLLLAELDLRFQPVEGLVAALGANRPGS
ncbi:DUF3348 domain-containing protein [Cupriavidus sp. H18C1]